MIDEVNSSVLADLMARMGHYKLAAIDVFLTAYVFSMIRSFGMVHFSS